MEGNIMSSNIANDNVILRENLEVINIKTTTENEKKSIHDQLWLYDVFAFLHGHILSDRRIIDSGSDYDNARPFKRFSGSIQNPGRIYFRQ